MTSWDAQGVLAVFKRSLENMELPHEEGFPPVPISLGGDGCSTNRGAGSGMQALFKQEFPWFLFSRCVAHRLELALKDAFSCTYFKEVDKVLFRLYDMYEKSHKKTRGLYEIHLAYKGTFPFLEGSKKASGTTWICHTVSV